MENHAKNGHTEGQGELRRRTKKADPTRETMIVKIEGPCVLVVREGNDGKGHRRLVVELPVDGVAVSYERIER